MTAVRIVTSADGNFAKQLAVLLASLRRSHGSDSFDLTVLTDSMDADVRLLVADGFDIRWVDVESMGLESLHIPRYVSKASLFRLLIPSLCDSSEKRILYLDADTLVRRSLSELWTMDLGGRPCAAVRDPSLPWAGAPLGLPWRELGIPPDTPYFNSGVMVVDLDRWRDTNLGPAAIDVLRTHELRYGDQCALNTVLRGDLFPLDPTWNLQAGHLPELESLAWVIEPTSQLDAAVLDPAIVHFNTSPFLGRPWEHGCHRRFSEEWFDLLDTTAFAGWRPPPPPERTPASVPRRVVRKLRRLASR